MNSWNLNHQRCPSGAPHCREIWANGWSTQKNMGFSSTGFTTWSLKRFTSHSSRVGAPMTSHDKIARNPYVFWWILWNPRDMSWNLYFSNLNPLHPLKSPRLFPHEIPVASRTPLLRQPLLVRRGAWKRRPPRRIWRSTSPWRSGELAELKMWSIICTTYIYICIYIYLFIYLFIYITIYNYIII